MSYETHRCPVCGRFHGSVAHEAVDNLHLSSLIAANTNFKPEAKTVTRKRLSAREAMVLTNARYKETLEYLT